MRRLIYNSDEIILDNGLFFGKGIFETIYVGEKPILLEEHIKRANRSIELLNLGESINLDEVKKFIYENKIAKKALKMIVTDKNLIFTVRDIKYNKDSYINGFTVKFSNIVRNNTSPITYIKSLNYLDNIMEYELAQKEGFNEAIFLNNDGYVSEGCTTNIFIVKAGKIKTPTIKSGILPGIIRGWVINNFKVEEKYITKNELLEADEIFMTNSLVGIIKVSELNGISFKDFITKEVNQRYKKFVDGGIQDYE